VEPGAAWGFELTRFPIRFERGYRPLSSAIGLPPSQAYVEIDGSDVVVRMGWAFRARFAKGAITSVAPAADRWLTRGVHGFGGRWLVNGAGTGILRIDLEPRQRASVVGIPVRLKQLLVSVEDPDRLSAALTRA
jgi:hypothetical protein